MTQRSAARIYGDVFDALAEYSVPGVKAIACKVWSQSRRYDFTPSDMKCDDSLIVLGLAVKPRPCAATVYGPVDEKVVP